ncbi:sodium hydrogen exchanger 3 [Paramuricea clavata]|uniref:Sodium hydrogen exchanger 3 n=1 Tax=Paramuricea clavata TaxID=317549 RepID=A0A7D9EL73_PARCT|nr:sodium hydrogen exchanger 3 [Paramuricea clavata]
MELCSVGKPSFFVVILLLWFQFCAVHSRPTTNATSLPQSTTNGSLTSTESPQSGSEGKRIKVAKFDFKYIATPFIVSVWVLLASLLKVVFHMTKRLSKVVPESWLVYYEVI